MHEEPPAICILHAGLEDAVAIGAPALARHMVMDLYARSFFTDFGCEHIVDRVANYL